MSDTRVSDAATRPAARRALAARRRRHPYEAHGRLWLAVFVAIAVAVAGATWGIRGATQASGSHSQIALLQAQVASLQDRIAADERTAASQRRQLRRVGARASGVQQSLQRINWALQSVPSQSQIAGMRDDVASYAGCIPQLQREIDGLALTWKIDAAKPATDSFKLLTTTPVSASCR